MKNAKIADKKVAGKITGLTVLEALFYVLSLPLIVILTAVFCVKTYQLVPYYSFWPFVGVILAGVLCLVFIIVVIHAIFFRLYDMKIIIFILIVHSVRVIQNTVVHTIIIIVFHIGGNLIVELLRVIRIKRVLLIVLRQKALEIQRIHIVHTIRRLYNDVNYDDFFIRLINIYHRHRDLVLHQPVCCGIYDAVFHSYRFFRHCSNPHLTR